MASVSVAISMAVMILAIGIVKGFQNEIKQKITNFNGNAIIKKLDINYSEEMSLFSKNLVNQNLFQNASFIKSIEPFCQKSCIARTNEENEGLQCRGITNGESYKFISKQIKRGKSLSLNSQNDPNQILISETTAKRLKLDTGDRLELIFIQDGQIRRRKPVICGIFNTGMNEVDRFWIITDIRMVQRVVSQGFDSINGISVFYKSLENSITNSKLLNESLPMSLTVLTVEQSHFQIFQWLNLLDMNVLIIIVLMVLVSVVNMITALIVLIVDRTAMIGLLKALGSRNNLIREIFLYNSSKYLLKGIIIGNAVGIVVGIFQNFTGILTLNEEIYYLSKVPFKISLNDLILLNILTFTVCIFILLIPSFYVAKINPAKSIKFE